MQDNKMKELDVDFIGGQGPLILCNFAFKLK
jgi:hypothetical protein